MSAPATLLLDRGAVERLNWQPRVCPPPLHCIASRVGDVLELVFVSDELERDSTRSPEPQTWHLGKCRRHRYRLEPLSDEVLTGTLITNTEGNEHNG